ncbi:hypothetical protein EG329_014083 [Mollisiaceae sp. DMI_Dod_QoI]|nr:hypothetical protein EG329_014083 [Helotiales sp. DMI_Dod_QoI]
MTSTNVKSEAIKLRNRVVVDRPRVEVPAEEDSQEDSWSTRGLCGSENDSQMPLLASTPENDFTFKGVDEQSSDVYLSRDALEGAVLQTSVMSRFETELEPWAPLSALLESRKPYINQNSEGQHWDDKIQMDLEKMEAQLRGEGSDEERKERQKMKRGGNRRKLSMHPRQPAASFDQEATDRNPLTTERTLFRWIQTDPLSGQGQTEPGSQNFTNARTRRPSQLRSIISKESTVDSSSRSPDNEEDTKIISRRRNSGSGTEEGDSWSSEDEGTTPLPKLTEDQRNHVERVMETFWNVMNKNWKFYLLERTRNPGAGASSANGNIPHTGSGASAIPAPSLKSLGKRPINDNGNERENEERPLKRNRDKSNLPADALEKIKYSCPYRKHNRRKYNIHTHRTCALSWFPNIARLKEHLYRTHRAPVQCHRCTLQFDDQRALKTHIKAKIVCDLVEGEPIEGFDLDIEELLRRRKKSSRDQPIEKRWREIYLLLFPDDDSDDLPSPFWDPPIDEPTPIAISIEDYIRQEVPNRVRRDIEDRLAAADYSYDLTLILSSQIMYTFEAQIDSCILEYRSQLNKDDQENGPHALLPSSSRSPFSAEEPRLESFLSPAPVTHSTPAIPDDWFATYLESENLAALNNMQGDLTQLYSSQMSE